MMKERLANLKFRNKRYKESYAVDVNETFLGKLNTLWAGCYI